MNLDDALLLLFATAAVAGGVLMLVLRHPMRVALALIATMISLGGIYGLLGVPARVSPPAPWCRGPHQPRRHAPPPGVRWCAMTRSTLGLTLVLLTACGDDTGRSSTDTTVTTITASTGAPTTGTPTSTEAMTTSGDEAGMTTGDTTDATSASTSTGTDPTTDPSTGDSTTGGAVPGAFCGPIPACDAAPPMLPGQGPEESGYSRGRDMLYVEGAPQWVLGKFTKWGFPIDKDVVGSTVHIFLDRGCAGAWEELGTTEAESSVGQAADPSSASGPMANQRPRGQVVSQGAQPSASDRHPFRS